MLLSLVHLKPKHPLLLNPFTTNFFFSTTPTTIPLTSTLLKQCKSLIEAKRIHQQIPVQGLVHLATYVVGMYVACDSSSYALTVLERLPPSLPTVFWWNALIRRAIRLGFLNDVLSLYRRMQRLEWRPDHYTFPFILKACGELPSFRRGASVYAVVCADGFESNVFVCNVVVAMYGRCGALDDARQMFEELSERRIGDVVSWNSIVAAYVQSGDSRMALEMSKRMTNDVRLHPDVVSLINVLPACASVGAS